MATIDAEPDVECPSVDACHWSGLFRLGSDIVAFRVLSIPTKEA